MPWKDNYDSFDAHFSLREAMSCSVSAAVFSAVLEDMSFWAASFREVTVDSWDAMAESRDYGTGQRRKTMYKYTSDP